MTQVRHAGFTGWNLSSASNDKRGITAAAQHSQGSGPERPVAVQKWEARAGAACPVCWVHIPEFVEGVVERKLQQEMAACLAAYRELPTWRRTLGI